MSDLNIDEIEKNENARSLILALNGTFNDEQLTKLFAEIYKGDLYYIPHAKCFYVWDADIWHIDTDNARVKESVRDLIGKICQDAEDDSVYSSVDQKAEVRQWLKQLSNGSRWETVFKRLCTMKILKGDADDFDADPWVIMARNGLVSLEYSKWLYKIDDADETDTVVRKQEGVKAKKITKRTRVGWGYPKGQPKNTDYSISCPTWMAHLRLCFGDDERGAEAIEMFQRLLGYGITGLSTEAVMPFLYGMGNNGKSVTMNILKFILGEYAGTMNSEILMPRSEPNLRGQAELAGKRLVVLTEPGSKQKIDSSKLKELTGNDEVVGCRVYERQFTFAPSWLFLCPTNYKPQCHETDEGVWRRILLVPFEKDITEELAKVGKKPDPDFFEKLQAEAMGIFKWLTDGSQKYFQHKDFAVPEWIKELTAEYRESQDIFKVFVDENLVKAPALSITLKDLHCLAKENGLPWMKRNELKTRIEALEGVNVIKGVSGRTKGMWVAWGIGGQKDSEDQTEEFLKNR
ncbi:phage/plasmid primase, P4 family [bacterium]|nr:phage/plasmid primase, P4 family [bacterium]